MKITIHAVVQEDADVLLLAPDKLHDRMLTALYAFLDNYGSTEELNLQIQDDL